METRESGLPVIVLIESSLMDWKTNTKKNPTIISTTDYNLESSSIDSFPLYGYT